MERDSLYFYDHFFASQSLQGTLSYLMLSAVNHPHAAMAQPEHLLHTINQIVESLNQNECRNLLYMCGVLDMDEDMNAKEVLKHKVMYDENGNLLLGELLLHMGRFDILKRVLKTSKEQLERDLQHRQRLPKFRVLMVKLSEEMTKDDTSSLKFLLSNKLPRERIEKAKNFLDVTIELEKQDSVSPENVDLLEECLRDIYRNDLAKKVASYKTSVATPQQHSSASCPLTTLKHFYPVQQTRHRQPVYVEHRAAPVYRQQNCAIPPDWYTFNTNPRGVCFIIDCVGIDGDMLEETFKALHFNVFLLKWLSVNDTISVLNKMPLQGENRNPDGFICCIISRGRGNRLLCTDTNSEGLHLESIRRTFTADVCPVLAGKPKMFFIQTYSVPDDRAHQWQQSQDEGLETDGFDGMSRGRNIPKDADVFWSHCWTDEQHLHKGQHRSVYLKALTDALQKGQQRKTKLVDIHTEVNGVVFDHNQRNTEEKYQIELKHTLTKDVVFQ